MKRLEDTMKKRITQRNNRPVLLWPHQFLATFTETRFLSELGGGSIDKAREERRTSSSPVAVRCITSLSASGASRVIALAGVHRSNKLREQLSVWSGTCQLSAVPQLRLFLRSVARAGIAPRTDAIHFSPPRRHSVGEVTARWAHLKQPSCLLLAGGDMSNKARRCQGRREPLAARTSAGSSISGRPSGKESFGTRVSYQLHAHAGDSNYPCEKQASLAASLLPACIIERLAIHPPSCRKTIPFLVLSRRLGHRCSHNIHAFSRDS